ncbi:MAG: hypothetical protein MNSN_02070 [Minisyncoccus archaeiphilus]|uniref:isochorismatase family cysteine hydrolase n=1 Tax=Minisyncoccus archaeiphilus TaxID=3238481 RepID=UPI002B1233B9|nr:MAG: hypothetical protein MNSN_02070 [Candidatus Parcubacteria bacterium]
MKLKRVLIIILSIIAVVIISLFIVASIAATPTKGNKISLYDNPRKALLVTDVQNDATKMDFKNIDTMIDSINKAIDKAKDSDMEIIYIVNELPCYGCKELKVAIPFGKDTPGAEIDNRIMIASDNIFSKWRGDAFSNSKLDDFLISNQINEIYLTGVDGLQCVNFTMQGAVNRGYRVHGIREAIDVIHPKNIKDVEDVYGQFGVDMVSVEGF